MVSSSSSAAVSRCRGRRGEARGEVERNDPAVVMVIMKMRMMMRMMMMVMMRMMVIMMMRMMMRMMMMVMMRMMMMMMMMTTMIMMKNMIEMGKRKRMVGGGYLQRSVW